MRCNVAQYNLSLYNDYILHIIRIIGSLFSCAQRERENKEPLYTIYTTTQIEEAPLAIACCCCAANTPLLEYFLRGHRVQCAFIYMCSLARATKRRMPTTRLIHSLYMRECGISFSAHIYTHPATSTKCSCYRVLK